MEDEMAAANYMIHAGTRSRTVFEYAQTFAEAQRLAGKVAGSLGQSRSTVTIEQWCNDCVDFHVAGSHRADAAEQRAFWSARGWTRGY